ncbi:MAG: hypothetical protein Q9171_001352 [Xanthocarpia ochracea]
MNVHVPYLANISKGLLLSPPSSPEMDQHLLASEGGHWPTVGEEAKWTQQANTSSFNIPAAQNRPHNFDVASESSKSPSSQQLAFSSRFFEDKDYHSAAPTDPCTRVTCRTYGGAPCAPGPSSTASHRTEDEEDDLLLMGSGDDEGKGLGDVPSRTAAERRAAKRKMKRFRLTHTQTRFLMSEFARQAHPDAAQRERLSREIPGLSPRQVQVWFQNRWD